MCSWTADATSGCWISVEASARSRWQFVCCRPAGALVGAGPDSFTYCKAKINTPWMRVDNSGNIKSVEIGANGTILAIGALRLLAV